MYLGTELRYFAIFRVIQKSPSYFINIKYPSKTEERPTNR